MSLSISSKRSLARQKKRTDQRCKSGRCRSKMVNSSKSSSKWRIWIISWTSISLISRESWEMHRNRMSNCNGVWSNPRKKVARRMVILKYRWESSTLSSKWHSRGKNQVRFNGSWMDWHLLIRKARRLTRVSSRSWRLRLWFRHKSCQACKSLRISALLCNRNLEKLRVNFSSSKKTKQIWRPTCKTRSMSSSRR